MINKKNTMATIIIVIVTIAILIYQAIRPDFITLQKQLDDIPDHIIKTMKHTMKRTLKNNSLVLHRI